MYSNCNQITKKQKKTENLQEYHKEYKKKSNWKEYISVYVDKNRDILNEKKRIDRKVKNDIFELIKKCIDNNSIHFTDENDLISAINILNLKKSKLN